VRQYIKYIREVHWVPEYHSYLTSKFQWPPHIPQQIEWQTTEYAMCKLTKPDCIQIQKIIHEWIPTCISPSNQPSQEEDKLCPTCHHHPETPTHLLRCNGQARVNLWRKLKTQLTIFCTKHNLDPHWYQLWWLGLLHPNGTPEHGIELYLPEFHPIFQSQHQIGWKQLYYGRIMKQWTHYLTIYQPNLNPILILTQMISIVWTYILETWASHNDNQHQATTRFPPNMLSDLHGIYAARDRLLQHIQDHLFNMTKEELMTKPWPYILNWINHAKNYICTELKIMAWQARTQMQDICLFFQPC